MKTQLLIDSSGLMFIDVMPPEPVIDRQTKQQKAAANEEPLSAADAETGRQAQQWWATGLNRRSHNHSS
jgi:hypothetical protein